MTEPIRNPDDNSKKYRSRANKNAPGDHQPSLPSPPIRPCTREQFVEGLDPGTLEYSMLYSLWDELLNEYGDEKQRFYEEELPRATSNHLAALRAQIEQLSATSKPILTIDEAAAILEVSPKRLSNLIYELKKKTGKLPNFICDAGGKLSRRIDREKLLEWLSQPERRRGRPPKIGS